MLLLIIITNKNMRQTKQKKVIMDYLLSVKTHPTAEEVYQNVRKILPNLSLGTVYRNLELFVKKGMAISLIGDKKRFDANTSAHNHFICKSCGKVFDVYDEFNFDFKKIVRNNKNIGKISDFDINFYGLCLKCQKKNK